MGTREQTVVETGETIRNKGTEFQDFERYKKTARPAKIVVDITRIFVNEFC